MKEYKDFCSQLALESGKIIKKYFRTQFIIEDKKDSTPVTIADKTAEEVMRNMIMREFPQHGIVGEEFGNYNEKSEYQWILDPIDGTKSFICGAINFGTLIALLKNGQPVLGVINQPILNEFLIGDNETTEINGVRTTFRNCGSISNATMFTTDHLDVTRKHNAANFLDLIDKVKLYRNLGDCYGYYLLATGFGDIMVDAEVAIWDFLPLMPIIKGAGGTISDYYGNDPIGGKGLIASSKEIHEEVIRILNK